MNIQILHFEVIVVVEKLTLVTISFLLPAVFYLFDGSNRMTSYHSILTSAFEVKIDNSDSIATYSNPMAQSTDPGGGGRIDISIRSQPS